MDPLGDPSLPISNEFVSRDAKVDDRFVALRTAYNALSEVLEQQLAPSRHRSIALTELETSSMWAMKAASIAIATEQGNVDAVVEMAKP